MSYDNISGINAYAKQVAPPSFKPAEMNRETQPSPIKNDASTDDLETTVTQVNQAVETANGIIDYLSRGVRFNYVESINQLQVQIVNKDTGEVLKAFPSEEMIQIAETLQASVGSLLQK